MAILYAIDSVTNVVYGIDSLKGTARPVGQLGLESDSSGLSSESLELSEEETLLASNLSDPLDTASLSTVDLTSGEASVIGSQSATDLNAIAHQGDILYGFSAESGLGTLAPETGEFTPSFDSSTLPVAMTGADVDESTNTLFAIGEDNALYAIDPSTGEASLVGDTGVDFNSKVGLAYSSEDEQLYALGNDSDEGDNLYQIDKTTGAASLVGNTGLEEVNSLELVQDESIATELVLEPSLDDTATNEIIIKVDPDMSPVAMESALESVDGEVVETTQELGIQLIEVEDVEVEEAIAILEGNPQIEYAEPNFVVSISDTFPNDPRFDELYALNNTGQTGGIPDADLDSPEGWDLQTGSSDTVIGVIDTGVDYTHPELDDNMWTNPGETPDNGIDDDGNGFVDDYFGYDFVNGDGDPFDDNNHGTHVSGTIAAEGNNGNGITGTAWDGQIMALKFLDASGFGDTFSAIQAVEYATMMGADLTSNSWGGGGFSEGLAEAIAASGEEEMLFIAAAGNDSSDTDIFPHYPSSYDLDNVISVAATDDRDNLAGFSNFGSTTVDLGAPGVDILSSIPGNGYALFNGTSMATPHVAGAVSLLLAEEPGLSAEEAKDLVLSSADPIAALEGRTVTGGRLNAFNSLAELGPPAELIGTPEDDVISGTNRGDFINGLGGNDILEGRGGDDEILGGAGNDDIGGGDGNDSLSGEAGQDRISGGSGEDNLNGGNNKDTLIGGSENDTLRGGLGNDRLIGVELADSSSQFGTDEIDNLAGGRGRDSFVLGEPLRVYYDDGNPLARGESDYALLSNFNRDRDSIKLAGTADQYRLDLFTSESGTIDAALIFDPGVTARGEKVAILQNVSEELRLDDSAFEFVDSEVGTIAADDLEELGESGASEVDSDVSVEKSTTPVIVEPPSEVLFIDEPNDTIPEAIDTGLSSENPGTFADSGFLGDNPSVEPTNEVDLLQFQLDAGDRVTADIDASVSGSPLDSILRIFDSDGNEVAVNDDSDGLDSFIEFTASTSDTYYAGVSSYANFDYDPFTAGSGSGFSTGEYDLEIFVGEDPFSFNNGSLQTDIRQDNGAIDDVLFGGSNFFHPGAPISDFGLQNGTDTSTFVVNDTEGFSFNEQPVTVERIDDTIVVTGTYTGGGANVDFTRTYSLVEGLNVLNVDTEFVNNGSDVDLSYFDTFDPDQGVDRGNNFETFNDVFTLDTAGGTATVGQASELDNLTFLLGSLNSDVTIASGSPFSIGDGFTLNDFFANPFDGEGELADQGTHIGIQLDLGAGETESFDYFQAYGENPEEAQEQFLQAIEPLTPIVGTEGDDVLTGTESRDVIEGLGGNDVIEGLAGNDTISGGRGNDLITAGDGRDSVTGDNGHDSILGGDGDDRLDGGNGSDRVLGELGDDTVNGGNGNDTITGGADEDSLFGDVGSDRMFGGTEDDTINGGNGNDTLEGGFGSDSLAGDAGDDRLVGVDSSNPGDEFSGFGTGEVDILTGGEGHNTFVLGDEANVFYDDGDPLTVGESDLAFITDFDASRNTIQLQGSADLYILDFFTSTSGTIDADLLYDPGVAAREEVIATLQDVSSELALSDPAFSFV
jgi:subtilisin family serine protease